MVGLKGDVACFCYLQAVMGLLLKYHWVPSGFAVNNYWPKVFGRRRS